MLLWPTLSSMDCVAAHLRHRGLDLALYLRFDLNHHTLYSHTHLIDLDAALAHLEFNGLHRLRLDFTQIELVGLVAHLDREGLVAHLDFGGLVPLTQRDALVAFRDFDGLVTLRHRLGLIVLNLRDAIVAHLPRFVVLHQGRKILFRLYADQFAALLVLERKHVEIVCPALRAAPRLDPADRLIIGQRPGRHQVGVVHAAHHDRLIDIAFQEIHNHFLANSRDVDRTPLLARPKRGDAHPTGAVDVVLARSVPMELDLHAAILVVQNLLAGGAHHSRRLYPAHARHRRHP